MSRTEPIVETVIKNVVHEFSLTQQYIVKKVNPKDEKSRYFFISRDFIDFDNKKASMMYSGTRYIAREIFWGSDFPVKVFFVKKTW